MHRRTLDSSVPQRASVLNLGLELVAPVLSPKGRVPTLATAALLDKAAKVAVALDHHPGIMLQAVMIRLRSALDGHVFRAVLVLLER